MGNSSGSAVFFRAGRELSTCVLGQERAGRCPELGEAPTQTAPLAFSLRERVPKSSGNAGAWLFWLCRQVGCCFPCVAAGNLPEVLLGFPHRSNRRSRARLRQARRLYPAWRATGCQC